MDLRKKVNAWVLVLAVLLTFGCGGDDPEPTKKNCILTKTSVTGITIDPTFLNYEESIFDNQGKLTGTIMKDGRNKNSFFYDNNGFIIKREVSDDKGVLWTIFLYEYNQSGNLSRVTRIASHPVTGVKDTTSLAVLEYNSNNRLKRIVRDSGNGIDSIFYPSNNQITLTKYWIDASTRTLKLIQTNEYHLDTNKNPYGKLRHLYFAEDLNENLVLMEHNVISLKSTLHQDSVTAIDNYSYQYNSESYPISWMKTFQSGSYEKGAYDYNCQ